MYKLADEVCPAIPRINDARVLRSASLCPLRYCPLREERALCVRVLPSFVPLNSFVSKLQHAGAQGYDPPWYADCSMRSVGERSVACQGAHAEVIVAQHWSVCPCLHAVFDCSATAGCREWPTLFR